MVALKPEALAGGPIARTLRAMRAEYIEPALAQLAFGGAAPRMASIKVSRNAHFAHELSRSRSMLWHWDAIGKSTVKLIMYLSPRVDHRHGCYVVMRPVTWPAPFPHPTPAAAAAAVAAPAAAAPAAPAPAAAAVSMPLLSRRHNVTSEPFKLAWDAKPWGRQTQNIPKPWLLDLMDRGFRPECVHGGAGDLIAFDVNIVHRGSRPATGLHRDFILFEYVPGGAGAAL